MNNACGGQIRVGIMNDRSNTHTHSKSLHTLTLAQKCLSKQFDDLKRSKGVKCLEKHNKVFQALVKLLLTSVSNSDPLQSLHEHQLRESTHHMITRWKLLSNIHILKGS